MYSAAPDVGRLGTAGTELQMSRQNNGPCADRNVGSQGPSSLQNPLLANGIGIRKHGLLVFVSVDEYIAREAREPEVVDRVLPCNGIDVLVERIHWALIKENLLDLLVHAAALLHIQLLFRCMSQLCDPFVLPARVKAMAGIVIGDETGEAYRVSGVCGPTQHRDLVLQVLEGGTDCRSFQRNELKVYANLRPLLLEHCRDVFHDAVAGAVDDLELKALFLTGILQKGSGLFNVVPGVFQFLVIKGVDARKDSEDR